MISPTQRPLSDNTQQPEGTDIHASGGIRTRNPSKRSAANRRLRPRGHRDLQTCCCTWNQFPVINITLSYWYSFDFLPLHRIHKKASNWFPVTRDTHRLACLRKADTYWRQRYVPSVRSQEEGPSFLPHQNNFACTCACAFVMCFGYVKTAGAPKKRFEAIGFRKREINFAWNQSLLCACRLTRSSAGQWTL